MQTSCLCDYDHQILQYLELNQTCVEACVLLIDSKEMTWIISFVMLSHQAGDYVTFAGFKVDSWKGVKSDATRLTGVAVETDFGANKFQNPYLNTYIMLYPGERHHIQFLSCAFNIMAR